jgi:hypothetical protein
MVHDAVRAFAPKLHIFAANLCGTHPSGPWRRIFANSEQKKERENHKVGQCLVLGVVGVAFMFHDVLDNAKMWLGFRVIMVVAMIEASEC